MPQFRWVFMIQQYERDWEKTASMGEFQGKSHCWLKRTQRLVSHLSKNNLIIPKIFGQIFCELMQQKFIFFEGACPVTSDEKPAQHFIKRTSYQQSNMVVMVWGALYLQELDDLPYIEGIINSAFYQNILKENVQPSVWPQAQEHLGYAGGQWSQTHQQFHLWMDQEKLNEGFGVVKSKSGLKSDWDAVAWP